VRLSWPSGLALETAMFEKVVAAISSEIQQPAR
jgi:hypothetical protein